MKAPKIRRILVAVDASPHSQAALEAAGELAARFNAELLGLFVEDLNLLRLASLPFGKEVGLFSALPRQLRPPDVKRQLRIQARRAQETFSVVVERREISGTFHVVRGSVSQKILEASAEVDIVLLGKSGLSQLRKERLGSTAQTLLAEAPGMMMILQNGARLGSPVVLVYDGSLMAKKALHAALTLLEQEDQPRKLTVLTVGDGPEACRRLQAEIEATLSTKNVRVQYRTLCSSSAEKVTYRIKLEERGTLVLPAKQELVENEVLHELLAKIDVPVLLVR
ncbi:MAG: universal stress protein [Anaerolineae bacterium]